MTSIAKKRILVVDDEPLVCDAVRMMLAFDGHEVMTADNAMDALAIFEAGKFDIVITDFAMPVMKGDKLAAVVKARVPGQPVIMITAHADVLRDSGNSLEAVDLVISKPFLLEHLRDAIAKVSPSPPAESEKAG